MFTFDGIASALGEYPGAAWLVVACDMPNLNDDSITRLVDARNSECVATVFTDSDEHLEPMCAIYEPGAVEGLLESILREDFSLFRCLEQLDIERVSMSDGNALQNINTPEESDRYRQDGVN